MKSSSKLVFGKDERNAMELQIYSPPKADLRVRKREEKTRGAPRVLTKPVILAAVIFLVLAISVEGLKVIS